MHINPLKRKKSTQVTQQRKKLKEVRWKNTPKKDVDKRVIRLLDWDIKRIVEGLKSATEDEHTPLIAGFELAISSQKRI